MFSNMTTSEILKLFAPYFILNYGLVIFCLFKLAKDKVKFLPKWGWALIIILLQLLGPIGYLLIGRERD